MIAACNRQNCGIRIWAAVIHFYYDSKHLLHGKKMVRFWRSGAQPL